MKSSYFCAFLFTIEDDKQRPALGLFFPDSEGEPLSRSDVFNERDEDKNLKNVRHHRERSEF